VCYLCDVGDILLGSLLIIYYSAFYLLKLFIWNLDRKMSGVKIKLLLL
jgi:hypothetical protein